MSEPSTRPLPALTPETEAFWTGGEHGELRIPMCARCARLLHPSQSVCPDCRTSDLVHSVMSGRATVVALTVNHHPWRTEMPPPYVIAVVALDEDPRVRLTTNLVDVAIEDTAIGMAVRACFERHGDVWLPMFEPTGDRGSPKAHPAPPQRTMARRRPTDKFESKVALTGVGVSTVGRRLMRPPVTLAVEACVNAIADAGLSIADIDGVATYPGGGKGGGTSEGGIPALVEAMGIRPLWHHGGMETSGQIGSVITAMLAVASGLCRHVLCFRTLWESTYGHLVAHGKIGGAAGRLENDAQWRLPYGAASSANWIGLAASAYMHRYGATREVLGHIALNARANAARNPLAVFREPMTMDDYLGARMISTPFGLYDCDAPCDGAVAVVVSAIDALRDLGRPAVMVDAVGTQVAERASWDQGTLTHLPMVFGPASHLWSRTDLRPADVDVALLYDGFTFNCLSWIEALGFCDVGEAAGFIGEGSEISPTGSLPLNTDGGQLSGGRLHGYGFLREAMLQLRGEAGDRQLDRAEVAVVATGGGGGHPGGCLLLTQRR